MSESPDVDTAIDQLRAAGSLKWSRHPDAIGAFVAEADFGTAPVVAKAMHEAIDSGLLGYLPDSLQAGLGQAFSSFAHERYSWRVSPEWVRPLADVAAGLVAAIDHFSEPGTPVILPTPAYMPFVWVPLTRGRQVIQVPFASDRGRVVYDLDALDAAFAAGGNLLVLVNPHNPTGRVLHRDEMLAVAEVVERHGGRVFSDEIHAPLVYDGHQHVPYATVSHAAADHSVTAVSASKAWNLPGTKCAQLVLTNDRDAETWPEHSHMFEHGASTLGVVANIAAYESGGPWLEELRSLLDRNRALLGRLLEEQIPEIGYTPPEGTYLAWLDGRSLGLGDHPAHFFLEHAGLAMTDGPESGDVGAGFMRYNFATPSPILERSVEQMATALRLR